MQKRLKTLISKVYPVRNLLLYCFAQCECRPDYSFTGRSAAPKNELQLFKLLALRKYDGGKLLTGFTPIRNLLLYCFAQCECRPDYFFTGRSAAPKNELQLFKLLALRKYDGGKLLTGFRQKGLRGV
jgi:hypothetical protein